MENKMPEKRFLCYWGGGINPTFTMKSEDFFCEENGYTKGDIQLISMLEVDDFTELKADVRHVIIRAL